MKINNPLNEAILIEDYDDIFQLFKSFGFNLEKDLKNLGIRKFTNAYTYLYQQIIEAGRLSYHHFVILHSDENNHFSISKLRLNNPTTKQGKRGGLRGLFLINNKNQSYMLFHLYSKISKENLSKAQDNHLIKIMKLLGEETWT